MNTKILILNVARESVEQADTRDIAPFLYDLTQAPEKALASRGNVAIILQGYENDSRELYEIPEARRWWQTLDSQFPELFYFLSPYMEQRVLYISCLLPCKKLEGQVSIDSDELKNFIAKRLGYMALFCWQIGDEPDALAKEITNGFGFDINADEFFGPLKAERLSQQKQSSVVKNEELSVSPNAETDGTVASLLGGLKSKEGRLICATGLCKVGSEPFIEPVLDALQKMTWEEAEQLAAALPNFGEAAVPALIEAAKSGKKSASACAMRALGAIGGKEAVEGLVERLITLPAKSEPTEALVAVGADAIPYLLGLLNHSKADVRSMAAFALGKIGDKRVFPQLEALAQTDRSDKVQGIATRALAWIKGEEECNIDLRDYFGDVPGM